MFIMDLECMFMTDTTFLMEEIYPQRPHVSGLFEYARFWMASWFWRKGNPLLAATPDLVFDGKTDGLLAKATDSKADMEKALGAVI